MQAVRICEQVRLSRQSAHRASCSLRRFVSRASAQSLSSFMQVETWSVSEKHSFRFSQMVSVLLKQPVSNVLRVTMNARGSVRAIMRAIMPVPAAAFIRGKHA